MHLNKKAQLEDIYWDLIIGIILIIITIIIIGYGIENSSSERYSITSYSGSNLASIILPDLLRYPINKSFSVLTKELNEHNINYGYEIFQLIGENFPEVNEKDGWAFQNIDYFLKNNAPNSNSCGSEFKFLLNTFFHDNDWIINVYKQGPYNKIFTCGNTDNRVLLQNSGLGLTRFSKTRLTIPLNNQGNISVELILGLKWQTKEE